MKILVLIIVLLFSTTSFAAEKVKPFKLLKKEILLNEAKKMKKSSRSISNKKALSVIDDEDGQAVKITMDVKFKGSKDDWNNLESKHQRWEVETPGSKYFKNDTTLYGEYTFKINEPQQSATGGSVFQAVGTDKSGSPVIPSMQIQYWDDGRVMWVYSIVDELFYLCDDMDNSYFNKTSYYFTLGYLKDFKNYKTLSFKIKPSASEQGEFILWIDDEKVIEVYGVNMSVGAGIKFRAGLYRWLEDIETNIENVPPTSLIIKNFSYDKKCEKVLDSAKCNYKSDSRESSSKVDFKKKYTESKTYGSKVCKKITGEKPKNIKITKLLNLQNSKNEKMIEVFKKKVIQKILAEVGEKKQKNVESWVTTQINTWMKKSTFSDELNKVKSRKEKRAKLIDKGIKWFQ